MFLVQVRDGGTERGGDMDRNEDERNVNPKVGARKFTRIGSGSGPDARHDRDAFVGGAMAVLLKAERTGAQCQQETKCRKARSS